MKHILCFSGGKDSMATAILAKEHNEPIDEIIYCEAMFDENRSAEYPEQVDFIYNVCKPTFKSWGVPFKILKPKKSFYEMFFDVVKHSKKAERNGKLKGFVYGGGCEMTSCKTSAIKKYIRENHCDAYQYIGIAIDEPKRLARLKGVEISLLAKYNYTEAMAKELCKQHGLLSPIYDFSDRSGCFFCPNSSKKNLLHLYKNHKDLFDELVGLEQIAMEKAASWCFDIRGKRSLQKIEAKYFKENL